MKTIWYLQLYWHVYMNTTVCTTRYWIVHYCFSCTSISLDVLKKCNGRYISVVLCQPKRHSNKGNRKTDLTCGNMGQLHRIFVFFCFRNFHIFVFSTFNPFRLQTGLLFSVAHPFFSRILRFKGRGSELGSFVFPRRVSHLGSLSGFT